MSTYEQFNGSAIECGHLRDEINLFDYWRVVRKRRKMIVAVVALSCMVAIITSLLLPKYYKSEATIVALGGQSGGGLGAALASQFGGLASLAGMSLGGSSTEAKIMAIFKSRTLAENVINQLNLMPVIFENKWIKKKQQWKNPSDPPTMEEAVTAFKQLFMVMSDKKAMTIKISAETKDPKLSANVVNTAIETAQSIIASKAFTMAKRNRIFLENQLAENKRDYLIAGKEISDFYRRNNVSNVEASMDVPIALKNGQGDKADVEDAIKALSTKKEDVEKKISEAKVTNVPQQVYLSYLLLHKEILAKMNGLLTTQYEMSKIEEAKEDLAFQVIDDAVVPIKRFKPKRTQIVIMSFMASVFGAVFLAFFLEYIHRMKSLPAR